jgi:hypothetical protein
LKRTLLTGILLALPMASWAADTFDIKPGLWEQTMSTEMSGMPQLTPEQLAKLPPAARAAMAGMAGGVQSFTTKVCHTKESLADARSYGRQDNSCTSKVTSMSATRIEVHTECTGRMKGTGDFVLDRVDAEHTKMTGTLKGEGDRPVNTKMSITGKWLSADCGDVKPLTPKK